MSVREVIAREVESRPGVTFAPHVLGGVEFRLRRRELGHVHGDRLADLPLPRRVRDELIRDGRAGAHHVVPDTGWVSYRMAGHADAAHVVELFRLSYERALAQQEKGAKVKR